MKKKLVIISSSPRKNGNSEILCQQFAKGAKEANLEVEFVNINAYSILPCLACEYCRHHHRQCVRKDDANLIIEKMIQADVWVLATPVYFYSVSGQMKLLIDRFFAREYEIREANKRKNAFFIITSGSPDHNQMVATIESLRGFIKVLKTVDEGGIIYGTGAFNKGDSCHHEAYHQAYVMAKTIV